MVEPDRFCAHRVDAHVDGFAATPSGGKLYVATDKGKGTGPNNFPPADRRMRSRDQRRGPSPTSAPCSTVRWPQSTHQRSTAIWPQWTSTVLASNRMKAAQEKIAFAGGKPRKPASSTSSTSSRKTAPTIRSSATSRRTESRWATATPASTMYGQAITPNQHKLALQFGVLDNFFDSGEVSGDGHVWSTAAIGTDYLEKTWQQNYRGEQRTYDYEGVVADDYPLLQKIPDVNEPASGYLWGNLAAHGKTYYHFGEYISTTFCDQTAGRRMPQLGPCWPARTAIAKAIAPGRDAARRVGRRREQMALAHSADRRQHRHQAGTGGPLRARSAGLQSHGPRPDPRRDFSAPSEAVGRRSQARQRHHARLS